MFWKQQFDVNQVNIRRNMRSCLLYPLTFFSKVIRTKHEDKARGFGFVSFMDPMDCAKAIREMQGKYLGTRYNCYKKKLFPQKNIASQ
jgi:RNA recognition motif-containing protein